MQSSDFKGAYLVWDWNGTLMDDAWLCIHALNTLLAERGYPLETFEQYRQRFRFPVRGYYEELGFNFGQDDDMETLSIKYITAYNSRRFECSLQAEAIATLEAFQKAGWKQAVLSAYREDMLHETIRHYKLSHYFETVRGLTNLQALGKGPLGLALMEIHGWPREKVILVGDTAHDCEVAQMMGVRCILVGHGHYQASRLETLGVPVYHDFKSLRQVLLNDIPVE